MLYKKTVVVSGAAGGIGKSIFLEIIKQRGYAIGFDIIPFKKSELCSELKRKGIEKRNFEYHQIDITSQENVRKVINKFKRIHGLINNAAILGGDKNRTREEWNKKFAVNARAAFELIELISPKLEENSSIVNIGSMELERPEANVIIYTSAKGALLGLTRAYSTDLARRNIRINLISPSRVFTPKNIERLRKENISSLPYKSKNLIYNGIVESQDVSDLVIFLLSDKSRKITGQNIIIDCGFGLAR